MARSKRFTVVIVNTFGRPNVRDSKDEPNTFEPLTGPDWHSPDSNRRFAQIRRLIRRLAKPLLLDSWWLTVKRDSLSHRADCEAAPEYREATFTFDLKKIADEDVLSFTIHEMMHCHVEELAHIAELLAGDDPFKQRMVQRAEERLTTNLELILTPLLKERIRHGP